AKTNIGLAALAAVAAPLIVSPPAVIVSTATHAPRPAAPTTPIFVLIRISIPPPVPPSTAPETSASPCFVPASTTPYISVGRISVVSVNIVPPSAVEPMKSITRLQVIVNHGRSVARLRNLVLDSVSRTIGLKSQRSI
ncbi:hypothetical protein DFH11DRAFT_1639701, partial [Phellopilus nigrolimitatus]